MAEKRKHMTSKYLAAQAANDRHARRYVTFTLGKEQYAIPLLVVREVIAYPEIRQIPQTPPHFLGVMELRGKVISVIDLRLKFGLPVPENSSETAVIIIDLKPHLVAVVVDLADNIITLEENEISPRPKIDSSEDTSHIVGVGKKDSRLVLLLDLVRALSDEDPNAAADDSSSRSAA